MVKYLTADRRHVRATPRGSNPMIHLQPVPDRWPRLRAALFYFAVCFAISFVLGPVRGLILTPWLGEARALALEMTAMLAVVAIVARLAVRRSAGMSTADRSIVGLLAVGLLILVQEALVRMTQGTSIFDVWLSQPVDATLTNLIALLLFSAMPVLVGASRTQPTGNDHLAGPASQP